LAEGSSPIEKDYAGPRLDDDERPSADFVKALLQWFKEGKVIPKRIAWQIVLGAHELLKAESTLVEVEIPSDQTADMYVFSLACRTPEAVFILHDLVPLSIGDTHGQFYDFLHLLTLTGDPSPTHTLVFNGDFVDRGSWSTEIILVLFAYKCA
jgi:serine/threonine-protein phosphatase 5